MLSDKRDYEAIDKLYVWHPFTQMSDWEVSDNLVIESGNGVYLRDTQGREYIDGVSSLWCNVHGHRKKAIDEAIRKQLKKMAHSTMLGLAHVPGAELAERLVDLAPEGLHKVFYSDSGSTAVEVALKMAYQFWQQTSDRGVKRKLTTKTKFLTFGNAYHGDTLGSVSVGGIELFHKVYRPLLFDVYRVPYPEIRSDDSDYESKIMEQVEKRIIISGHELAAIVIEPLVQGAAGMRLSSPRFLRFLSRVCEKHGLLLILDEVATGFGRTGSMFACQQAGITPDFLCLAKGLTGGYLPLAATLTTDYVYKAFLGAPAEELTFFHGHTYTGNPLACAAALANLDIFVKEKTLVKLQPKIELLATGLTKFERLSHVKAVRQCGFMVGIELAQDGAKPYPAQMRMGHQVCLRARQKGLIIRPLGDVIVLMPPLSIHTQDLKKILKIVYESIREVTEN